MAQPEEIHALTWLADKAWMVVTVLIGVVWKLTGSKIQSIKDDGMKALLEHTEHDKVAFKAIHDDLNTQRANTAKLFDQMREEGHRSEERHRELMQRTHDAQQSIVMALNQKADR